MTPERLSSDATSLADAPGGIVIAAGPTGKHSRGINIQAAVPKITTPMMSKTIFRFSDNLLEPFFLKFAGDLVSHVRGIRL